MTQISTRGRHRAACRPLTPLTSFGDAVSVISARRSLVAVASSGLAISMAATTAVAAPESSALPQVDLSAVTAETTSSLGISPTVTVPATATISFDEVTAAATLPKSTYDSELDPLLQRAAEIEQAERAAADAAAAEAAAARQAAPASRSNERTAPAEAAAADTAQTASVEAAPSASGSAAVDIAFRYVGTPYAWGGASPAGFDCSGFTWYVFQQLGVDIPRSSAAQRNAGTVVSAAEARPGDLVWWPGHIGIYTGNGNHIAARNPSKPLQAGPISDVGRGAPVYIRVVN